jgi:hypothetical protein
MRADEAHQQELENRRREEEERLWARHRTLAREFRDDFRAMYRRICKPTKGMNR